MIGSCFPTDCTRPRKRCTTSCTQTPEAGSVWNHSSNDTQQDKRKRSHIETIQVLGDERNRINKCDKVAPLIARTRRVHIQKTKRRGVESGRAVTPSSITKQVKRGVAQTDHENEAPQPGPHRRWSAWHTS